MKVGKEKVEGDIYVSIFNSVHLFNYNLQLDRHS